MKAANLINKSFNFNLGRFNIAPTYWQAAAIVFLLFLLVWTLARLRHMYVNWSIGKSAMAFFVWGFLMAVILEGFFIISGKTLFTVILGWKNAPKPVSVALDAGRSKLINVLGVTEEAATSDVINEPTSEGVILDFQSLPPAHAEEVRKFICEP